MFHSEFRLERGRRLQRERLQLFLRRLDALRPRPFDVFGDGGFRFFLNPPIFLTKGAIRNAALLEPVRGARFVDETSFKVKDFALPKGRGDRRLFRAVGRRVGSRVGERRSVELLIVGDQGVGAVAFAVRNFKVSDRRQRVSVGAGQRFRLEWEENLLQNRRVRPLQTLDPNDSGELREARFLRLERRRENRRDRPAEFAFHCERTLGRQERRRRNERDRSSELGRRRRERPLRQVEPSEDRIVRRDLRKGRDSVETKPAVENERVGARRRDRKAVFRKEKVNFAVETRADDEREVGRNGAVRVVRTNDERVEPVLTEQFDENERPVERRSLTDEERLPRELGDRARGRLERRR